MKTPRLVHPFRSLSAARTVGTLLLGIAAVALCTVLVSSLRADSLWNSASNGRSMFSDRKAGAKGDILTIVIAESAVAQSSQNKSSNRESSLEDAIARFVYAGVGTARRGQLPGTAGTGKASYSGGGDVSNSQSLSARAAVSVTDVLPNGNLVVEGVRVVTFSGETQYVVLRGIVRADDVSRDNSVVSTNIADARVEFHSEGSLTDAQKRGWLAKVYEKLRPL